METPDAELMWILAGGLGMCAIALVGGLTLLLPREVLRRLLLPLVAFSAGSLLGGAFFHMLPAALSGGGSTSVFAWLLAGFTLFFLLEQFHHWHHCHRADAECRQPLTYLILVGDGLHNFLAGSPWPVPSWWTSDSGSPPGWPPRSTRSPRSSATSASSSTGDGRRARRWPSISLRPRPSCWVGSSPTRPPCASRSNSWSPSRRGNFLYIAASDLVPEVNRHFGWRKYLAHLVAFAAGLVLLYLLHEGRIES